MTIKIEVKRYLFLPCLTANDKSTNIIELLKLYKEYRIEI